MISIISMHRCLADQAGGDGLGDGGQCPDMKEHEAWMAE